jgi:hypothetical protein
MALSMKLLTLALFTASLWGQTTAPAVPVIAGLPSYFAAAGYGFAPTSSISTATASTEGWISMGVQIAATNYYSVTTVDMSSSANIIRTGFARVMAQSGNMTLLARVDGGISTPTPTISSFSAGGIVTYNLKGLSPKLAGTFFVGEIRMTASPSGPAGSVNIGAYFGVLKSFGSN